MAKSQTVYLCESCGAHHPKWVGRCSACGTWDSLVEETIRSGDAKGRVSRSRTPSVPLTGVPLEDGIRVTTGLPELDRVLGGGILPGSVTLVGGDPGVGKSTLLLQVFGHLGTKVPVLYVSGEESLSQVASRARRLKISSDGLRLLSETSLEAILSEVESVNPAALALDSIQTARTENLNSAPGSLSQVRECAVRVTDFAKARSLPVFLVGHITKDGLIAGPKALEHIVDTVLYFEGERYKHLKILRAVKNRFGATHEIALLEMASDGLRGIENPSATLLADRPMGEPGSVIGVAIQGTRPLLFEIQALTSPSAFGMAKRMSVGLDRNRVQLLSAVLERAARMTLGDRDLFVNVVGGVGVEDTALDLPLCLSVASAYRGLAVPGELAAFGEVGLAGEVRGVGSPDLRVMEAAGLGFKRCLLPRSDHERLKKPPKGIKLQAVGTLREAVELLFR